MTVASEFCGPTDLRWTGAETSFAPGFAAADAGAVKVSYLADATADRVDLVMGVHYAVNGAGGAAVTVVPLVMPPAPGAVRFLRDTPATQEVDFANLRKFDNAVHTHLHDRAAMRDAEMKMRLGAAYDALENAQHLQELSDHVDVVGAAAEAAREGAEAAAVSIATAPQWAFASKTAIATLFEPAVQPAFVNIGGYLYSAALAEPNHSGKAVDKAGNWYRLAERVLTPPMFNDDIAALFDAHNQLLDTVVDLGSDRAIEFPAKISVVWSSKPVIGGKNIVLKYTGTDIVDIAIKFTVDGFDVDFRGWIVDANSKAYCGFACFGPTDQLDARDAYAEDFGAKNAYRSGTSFLYGFGIWFYRAFNKLKLVRPVAHNVRCAAGAGDPGQIGAHGIAINGTLTTESRFVDIDDPDVDGVFNEDGTINIDQDGILIFGIPPTATSRTEGYARIHGGTVRNARGRSIKMARQNALVDGTMFIRNEATYFKSGLMEIDFQFFEGVARNIKYRHETSTCEHIVSGSAQVDTIATELLVDGVTGWIEPGLDDVPLSIVQLTYSSGGHAPMKGIVRGVDHKGRYVANLARIATGNDLKQEHFLIEANRIQTLGNALVRFEGNVGRMTIRNNQHAGGDVAVVSEVSGVALWDGGRNTGLLPRKFIASLAGCTTVPTGDVIVNREGDFVSLVVPAIVGTSNSASCVLTGVPVGIRPNTPQIFPVRVQDNGAFKAGHAYVKDDGTIELYPDAAFGGWTSSGDKGISLQTITYAI